MTKQVDTIKELLEKTLEKLTVEGRVEVVDGGDYPQFVIRTPEAGLLIGEKGQHLMSLSHIFKKIVDAEFKRQDLETVQFLLDVNDYQVKKIEDLKNIAKMNAQRVRFFSREIELDPMSSYERRIVHMALAEYPDIKTESLGEDQNRRIVIKPL